ncbi:GDSL-like lipase/acylhydrolase [Medicago truncatula]|uniref:GDSL-like lipase/acylhydrolase n=1 Tax=Medicago truncatula TaxID=3880 RepID=G7K7H4_MEDTR|nr:GDSL-like lipase/acylhydrolase [Medicago truncatula]
MSLKQLHFTVSQYQDFLVDIAEDFVRKLHSLGARKLSITGLVPIGCLPLERATNIFGDHACNEKYNRVALQFNAKLENMISKLNKELPQLKALSANAYEIVNDIITRPSFYGMFSLFVLTTYISILCDTSYYGILCVALLFRWL